MTFCHPSGTFTDVPKRVSPLAKSEGIFPRDSAAVDPRGAYRDAWITQPLDAEWTAYYRLVPQAGEIVIAEVRVLPIPEAGESVPRGKLPELSDEERWFEASLEFPKQGTPPKVPRGGLTARRLRSGLRLGAAIERARKLVLDALDKEIIPPEWTRFTREMLSDPPGTGRRGRDDLYYARIAGLYVARLAAGSRRPVADLADEWGAMRGRRDTAGSRISQAVHEARRRGLLTESPPGRAGGELTEKAKTILAEAKEDR